MVPRHAGQDPRTGQNFPIAVDLAVVIGINEALPEGMAGGHVHKLAMNGPALIDALDRTIGRQPLNSLADFHRRRC